MTEITEDLPLSTSAAVDADHGAVITYIDRNYEVRTLTVPDSRRWTPNFLVPNSDDSDMVSYLKMTLRREAPNASEIRHLRTSVGFILCAITPPG